MAFLAYVLLVAAASLSSALGAFLVFDSAGVTREPGAPLELGCGVQGNFRHCLWETEDGTVFQVEDVHAGLHQGLRAPDNLTLNQCGVVLDPLTEEHTGTWTCKVFIPGAELRGEKTVGDRQAKECQPPFLLLGTGCYYFHQELLTWDEAGDLCRGLGSTIDLAKVDDCHELQLLWNYILTHYGNVWHWTGGSDRNTEGTWHWTDGTLVPTGTPFWREGFPNGGGDCLPLHSLTGYFMDYPCEKQGPSICQDISV